MGIERKPHRRSRALLAEDWSDGMIAIALAVWRAVLGGCENDDGGSAGNTAAAGSKPQATEQASPALIAEGQRVFRFDTFGDEQLWTDKLRLHEVVEKNVDPTTALKVGLKVDADVLPAWHPRRRSISRARRRRSRCSR